MNLNNDDLFMNVDLFDTVYDATEKGIFDLVCFSVIESNTYNSSISEIAEALFHDYKDGLKLYQPELTYFAISQNNKFKQNDLHVWRRLTKADIYFSLTGQTKFLCSSQLKFLLKALTAQQAHTDLLYRLLLY